MAEDVPSPIDFQNAQEVLAWIEDTQRERPWRPQFFKAFAEEISRHFANPITIFELGAGPGMLAEEILRSCLVQRYVLLDSSLPMQKLAHDRLASFSHVTEHVTKDFRRNDWESGLELFDGCITMQAVHEVRHKRHVPKLLAQILRLIRPEGYFWFADHYLTPSNNPDLFFQADEQPEILSTAGFENVTLILDVGNMALYRAQRPGAKKPTV
jgi:SAM-dependent methyltransferase